MPPAKRRRISHSKRTEVWSHRAADVPVPRVPRSPSLLCGLQDLSENGGLQLFIDALAIYRQNEVKEQSQQRLWENAIDASTGALLHWAEHRRDCDDSVHISPITSQRENSSISLDSMVTLGSFSSNPCVMNPDRSSTTFGDHNTALVSFYQRSGSSTELVINGMVRQIWVRYYSLVMHSHSTSIRTQTFVLHN